MMPRAWETKTAYTTDSGFRMAVEAILMTIDAT